MYETACLLQLHKIQRKDLIAQIFSLHNKDELKRLSKDWIRISLTQKQPLGSFENMSIVDYTHFGAVRIRCRFLIRR